MNRDYYEYPSLPPEEKDEQDFFDLADQKYEEQRDDQHEPNQ